MCAQGPAAVQCTTEHPDSKPDCSRELKELMWVVEGNPSAGGGLSQSGRNFPRQRHPLEGQGGVHIGDLSF